MVTGRNKRALEDHFDKNAELEDLLEKSGRHDLLAAIRHSSNLANMHYVRQGDPRGLGDAVLTAAAALGAAAAAGTVGHTRDGPREGKQAFTLGTDLAIAAKQLAGAHRCRRHGGSR
jgi:UTP--glucose-1-phosphate uridylyltransferase